MDTRFPNKVLSGKGRTWLLLALLVVLCLPALRPFARRGILWGHDLSNVFRVFEVGRALRDGHVPVRWFAHYGGGYGNPQTNFYSPLFFYVGGAITAAGAECDRAASLACVLFVLGSGVAMFVFARRAFSPWVALFAALFYVYAPYRLLDLFVRGAYAEAASFLWFPLIFHFARPRPGPRDDIALAFCIAGLCVTHNIMSLMFFPVALARIWSLRIRAGGLRGFIEGGGVSLAGLGLSAWFWLPALLEKKYVYLGTILTQVYGQHFLRPGQLVHSQWGFGYSVEGPDDTMSFEPSKLLLLLCAAAIGLALLRLAAGRGPKNPPVFMIVLFGLSIVATLGLSQPVWDALPLAGFIQFPWRFLALATFAGVYLSAFSLQSIPWRWVRVAATTLCMVLCIAGSYPKARVKSTIPLPQGPMADFVVEDTFAWSKTENYRPLSVARKPSAPARKSKLKVLEGSVKVLSSSVKTSRMVWVIEAETPALLELQTYAFPGWQVRVDRKKATVGIAPGTGVYTLRCDKGAHTIVQRLGRTHVRLLSELLSALTFVAAAVSYPLRRERARKIRG